MGSVLMPGCGAAARWRSTRRAGSARGVAELVLQAPLVLPEQHAVRLQVTVSDPDESGASQIEIYLAAVNNQRMRRAMVSGRCTQPGH